MIYFWIGLAVALIIVGLFVVTQGGDQLGTSFTVIGIFIGLILAICPAHSRDRIMISDAATTARQATIPTPAMTNNISSIVMLLRV